MKKVVFAILIFSVLLFVLSFLSYFYLSTPLDIISYPATLEVTSDTAAFNLSSNDLNFGKVPAGSSGARSLVFSNDYGINVVIIISSSGDISEFLSFSSPVYVKSGESLKIAVTALPEFGSKQGTYEGSVKFEIRQDLKRYLT